MKSENFKLSCANVFKLIDFNNDKFQMCLIKLFCKSKQVNQSDEIRK